MDAAKARYLQKSPCKPVEDSFALHMTTPVHGQFAICTTGKLRLLIRVETRIIAAHSRQSHPTIVHAHIALGSVSSVEQSSIIFRHG